MLALAIMYEIAGAISLGFSDGFTRPLSTGAAVLFFVTALYLVSRVMKTLPVSIAYPIWAGVRAAGASLIGVLVLGEPLGTWTGLRLLLVVARTIWNVGATKTSGC